jgi:hypothetical protein
LAIRAHVDAGDTEYRPVTRGVGGRRRSLVCSSDLIYGDWMRSAHARRMPFAIAAMLSLAGCMRTQYYARRSRARSTIGVS